MNKLVTCSIGGGQLQVHPKVLEDCEGDRLCLVLFRRAGQGQFKRPKPAPSGGPTCRTTKRKCVMTNRQACCSAAQVAAAQVAQDGQRPWWEPWNQAQGTVRCPPANNRKSENKQEPRVPKWGQELRDVRLESIHGPGGRKSVWDKA